MKGEKPKYRVVVEPSRRRPTRMDAVRGWLASAPTSVLRWALGILAAEVISRLFEPEIAALASLIRTLIGL